MKKANLSRSLLAFILTLGVVFLAHSSSRANETEDLKAQVKQLHDKVNSLEQQLAKDKVQQMAVPAKHASRAYVDDWDPWAQMEMMQRQMNQLMADPTIDFNPREDIKETASEYIISMDIPGMEKDKINIEVKNGMLIISGERSSEVKEDKPHQFYRQERSFGHFVRSLALPENVKSDQIDAQYDNGVLTIKLPKKQASPPASVQGQKIKIK